MAWQPPPPLSAPAHRSIRREDPIRHHSTGALIHDRRCTSAASPCSGLRKVRGSSRSGSAGRSSGTRGYRTVMLGRRSAPASTPRKASLCSWRLSAIICEHLFSFPTFPPNLSYLVDFLPRSSICGTIFIKVPSMAFYTAPTGFSFCQLISAITNARFFPLAAS